MKKFIAVVLTMLLGMSSVLFADNIPTNGTDGQVLYWNGTTTTGSNANWGDLQSLITVNNITVPSSVNVSANGGTATPSAGVDFVGTGITSSNSGGTTAVDLSNLQTTQGTQNTTNISNLTNTVTNNTADLTNLGNQVNTNTSNISTLNTTVNNVQGGLVNEINQRIAGDNYLQSQVNNTNSNLGQETVNRIAGDTYLQNQVDTTNSNLNVEKTDRMAGDEMLQNNINTETQNRIAGDNLLNTRIDGVDSHLSQVDNRLDRLERTKYVFEGAVRLYDGKKWQVQMFDGYNMRNKRNDSVGIRAMFKVGKSYEERQQEMLDARLHRQALMIRDLQKQMEAFKKSNVSIHLGGK